MPTRARSISCLILLAGLFPLCAMAQYEPLTVTSGEVLQLGLPGVTTNYGYSSITVDAGGTLEVAGNVSLSAASNIVINGQMIAVGLQGKASGGANGGNGANGVLPSDPGGSGESGSKGNQAEGFQQVSIIAANMTVNGTIQFNPAVVGGDGGRGGDGGTGVKGASPVPGRYVGGLGGDGGSGGTGGDGGDVLSGIYLDIAVTGSGSDGNFILGTNGIISLDNAGTGGDGGDGGDGANAADGGSSINGALAGGGGTGGAGGFGGSGGQGGAGGFLRVEAYTGKIDLEGQLSLRGGDGGKGGDAGKPADGGNGGNGSLQPNPNPSHLGSGGGNGGLAGNAYYTAIGGDGGRGGIGGTLELLTPEFINNATIDLSGGTGGDDGAGQPAGVGKGGKGGAPAPGSNMPPGQKGADSPALPPGKPGADGYPGNMDVEPTGADGVEFGLSGGWQTSGSGILSFAIDTNTSAYTVEIASQNGPFAAFAQMNDPRYQYDSGVGQYMLESNEPVELTFNYRWLSTNGWLDVRFGGATVARLEAPPTLTNGFSNANIVLLTPPEASGLFDLNLQLNSYGSSQIQTMNFSVQALPLLPVLSIGQSPYDSFTLNLDWYGATNENYQVQYRASLSAGVWTNLDSPIAGQGAAAAVQSPTVSGEPAGFYRLVMTPAN